MVIMGMKDFDLVSISFILAVKNGFDDVTVVIRRIVGDMFDKGYS